LTRWFSRIALISLLAGPAVAQDLPEGSQDDGGFLERQIESLLSGAGREVIVSGFEGALSSRASLDSMTIADDEGVWLVLRNAELDWNRSALLRGRLEVTSLTAEEILLPRLPNPGEDLPSPEAQPFSLPDLPVAIEIGEIAAGSVFLGAPLLGEEATVSLAGSASLSGGEGTAQLAIERIDGTAGSLRLSGSFDNESQDLVLELQLDEPEDGIAANALDLPGRPSVELSVDGAGQLSDFTADIRLATAGEERLSGEVRLIAETVAPDLPPNRRFEAALDGDLAPVFSPQFEPFFGDSVRLRAAGTTLATGGFRLDALELGARALELSGQLTIDALGAPQLIDLTGSIEEPEGGKVLLPVGEDLRVDRLGLEIDFDAEAGPDLTAAFTLRGLSTPGAEIEELGLTATGQIVTGAGPEAVNAVIDFAAAGVDLADPGTRQALGEAVSGSAEVAWEQGQPVLLERLLVEGESFGLTGEGQLSTGDDGPVLRFTGGLAAEELAAFSGIADRPLGGAAQLDVALTAGLASRAFSIRAEGQTTDLAIGQAQFDRVFDGAASLRLDARRDATGTVLDVFEITSEAAELTAVARLTSGESSGRLELSVEEAAEIDPSLSGPVSLLATLDGSPEAGFDIEADLEAIGSALRFDGRVSDMEAEAPLFSGALALERVDLARLAGLADRPLDGVLTAEITGQARSDLSQFSLRGSIVGQEVQTGLAELDAALAGRAEIAVDAARMAGEEAIQLRAFQISSDTVAASASGRYAPGDSRLRLEAEVPDLEPFGNGLFGALAIDASAEEDATGWDVEAEVEAVGASFRYAGRIEDLQGDAPLLAGELALEGLELERLAGLADRPLSGRVEADLRGELRTDLSRFDLAGTVLADGVETGVPELDAALRGEARIGIDINQPQAGAPIAVDRLSVNSDTLSASLSGRYAPGDSDLRLMADVPDLAPFGNGLFGALDVDATASEDAAGWSVDARVEAVGARFAYTGRIEDLDSAAPLVSGDLSLAGLDLARLAGVADRPLSGRVEADLSGELRTDLSRFDLAGQVIARQVTTGIAELDAALAGTARLDIDVDQPQAGAPIRINRLAVTSDTLTARASGRYAPGESRLRLEASVPDLAPFGNGLFGALEVDASAAEDAEGWAVDAEVEAVGAAFTYSGRLEDLGSAAPLVTGDLSLTGLDLARLAGVADRPLSGRLAADLSGQLRTDLSRFDVTGTILGRQLQTGIAELDAALRGEARIAIDVDQAQPGAPIRINRLSLTSDTVIASASGAYAEGQSRLRLDAQVPELAPFGRGLTGPAEIEALAEQAPGGWQIEAELDALGARASYAGRVTGLEDAAPRVSGTARVEGLNLARLSGLTGRPLRGTLSARLEGEARSDLGAFDITAELSGQGVATGIADLDGLLAGPLSARVAASKEAPGTPIRIAALTLDTGALNISASGRYGGGQSDLNITARLADVSPYVEGLAGPVTASGRIGEAGGDLSLNLTAQGPGGIRVALSGTAAPDFSRTDLSIDGTAPLAAANRFIAPQSLQGTASFDLALNGPPGLDALSGTVFTEGARLVLPGPGIVMEQINATVRLSGQSAQISATAQKQEGGALRVSGSVGLAGAMPVDLTVELGDLVITDPALYRTVASGTLRLTGAIRSGALAAGTIVLGTTEIRVPTSGFGTVTPIPDLIHLNQPPAVRATRARAGLIEDGGGGGGDGGGGVGPAVALDVTIIADNQIFVRGRGLDAELGGRLQLSGTTSNIIPSGQFDLIRGRLDILGQRLTLTEGRISLRGNFEPYLRLVAQTEANDVELFIILEGPAAAPEISFESQPELPEDEVLAQLLFGRSITDISPLQAARLASAVATLAGRGDGVVSRLREEFGLDDFDITTDDDGNLALRAGAYLSENVYSDVTVSATGDTEVNLNLDLTPSLTARGSVTTSGETSLGIFFERDY
jgi:autotransporter translocation and assembly factor TamB